MDKLIRGYDCIRTKSEKTAGRVKFIFKSPVSSVRVPRDSDFRKDKTKTVDRSFFHNFSVKQ